MAIEKPILHHPTPLHDWTAEHSRTNVWAPWFGFSAISVYGDVVEEAGALAHGVGIADFTPYPTYAVDGTGAAAYLDRLLTRRATTMGEGEVKEALICASSGHVIALCTILRLEEARFLLMAASEVGMRLLEGRADESVTIERSSLVPLALFGPKRGELLSELGVNLELDEDGFVTSLDHDGVPVLLADAPARTAPGGGGSFVMVKPDDAGLEWQRLLRQGRDMGRDADLVPVGLDALERRRIDLVVPRENMEFRSAPLARAADEKVLPDELGLAHLVEHDGRIFAGGHALKDVTGTRRLVRLEVDQVDQVAPVLGEAVRSSDRRVGRVTSAYEAPELGIAKALALIDAQAGDNLTIGFGGEQVSVFTIAE